MMGARFRRNQATSGGIGRVVWSKVWGSPGKAGLSRKSRDLCGRDGQVIERKNALADARSIVPLLLIPCEYFEGVGRAGELRFRRLGLVERLSHEVVLIFVVGHLPDRHAHG